MKTLTIIATITSILIIVLAIAIIVGLLGSYIISKSFKSERFKDFTEED